MDITLEKIENVYVNRLPAIYLGRQNKYYDSKHGSGGKIVYNNETSKQITNIIWICLKTK